MENPSTLLWVFKQSFCVFLLFTKRFSSDTSDSSECYKRIEIRFEVFTVCAFDAPEIMFGLTLQLDAGVRLEFLVSLMSVVGKACIYRIARCSGVGWAFLCQVESLSSTMPNYTASSEHLTSTSRVWPKVLQLTCSLWTRRLWTISYTRSNKNHKNRWSHNKDSGSGLQINCFRKSLKN